MRKECTKVYEDGTEFEIGKAVTVRDDADSDVTIIASGFCVAQSILAARELEKEGVRVRILDMFTWKPLDDEAVVRAARETGAIVVAENHNVTTGLGAAVSETVVRNAPVPMELIGIQDRFGQVGSLEYLAEQYGLTVGDIASAAKRAVARKA